MTPYTRRRGQISGVAGMALAVNKHCGLRTGRVIADCETRGPKSAVEVLYKSLRPIVGAST